MMKLFRDKKGASPVVSAVIMILVAMLGMSALFAFFVNYSRDFQMGSGSAVLESITVEDVWFRDSGTVEVWVYNYGKVNVTITDVYVNSNAVNFAPEDITIPIGEHGKIVVYSLDGQQFVVGVTYGFKIVTARGTSFEGSYTWQ